MMATLKRRLPLAGLALVCLGAAYAVAQTDPPGAEHPIQGGTFEASGVVAVPSSDGVLFVDDGREDAVLWMRVDRDGRQREPAVPVPLGIGVGDLEGITTDGIWYYAVGSQSKPGFVDGPGLVRFRFDPAARRIEQIESVSGLRQLLLSQLPSVAARAGRKPSASGFNIEGLAWDARGGRLLLGLRAPVIDGDAVVIPLTLGDGPLEAGALRVADSDLIRLPLENAGIRSMEFDAGRGAFRVLAAGRGATSFRLWNWSGGSGRDARLEAGASFAARLKPEGVTPVRGAQDYTLIVFDTSRYVALQ